MLYRQGVARFKLAVDEEAGEPDLNTTKESGYGYDIATWKSPAVLTVGPEERDWSGHFPHHAQRGATAAAGSPSRGKQQRNRSIGSTRVQWMQCRHKCGPGSSTVGVDPLRLVGLAG